MAAPLLSVIVVFHDMAREAPRTLHTLSPAYQRGVGPDDYEVVAIDNGSAVPLDAAFVEGFGPNFRLLRRPPSPSPTAAINDAVRRSRGAAVMVCIDGARMLSPGVVRTTLAAFRAFENPVVATLAWHLGPRIQNLSMLEGYNQAVEDRLLDSVDWRADGYELFRIACFAGSSAVGWFGSLSESNCLAVRRAAYESLGGFDERFQTPGGGLVNLDFYKRACEGLPELVLLLGEGTFHQFHGGVATNVPTAEHPWPRFHDEYLAIRHAPFAPPTTVAQYIGHAPAQCMPFLSASVQQALTRLESAP